jgi:transposase
VLAQLKNRMEKTQPQGTSQNALGKAIGYLARNLEQTATVRRGRLLDDRQQPCRTRHQALRDRKKELVVQRHAQRCEGSAQLYSLVETAQANGQESYAWLPMVSAVEDYEALLPWN